MRSKQFESVLSGTALSVPHKHTLELHIIPTLMGRKSITNSAQHRSELLGTPPRRGVPAVKVVLHLARMYAPPHTFTQEGTLYPKEGWAPPTARQVALLHF
jgi:hypothetical protein